MSGGKKLAESVAEHLGYRCISREIIIRAADEYGVPEGKLFEAIQKTPSIFQKLSFERDRYLAYIQASLCEYAKDDNLVYHGNAGHFLLEGISHVLRVRLVADMPYRIRAAMEQFNFSEKEALKYIERVDKGRVKWTNFLYGRDWRSPELYDMVLNLERTDLDFISEMVIHAVRQIQFQITPQSSKDMGDLLLASRVRVALAGIANLRLDRLAVKADADSVTIRGRVRSQELLDDVLATAGQTPGVETVNSELQVDYRSYGVE
jgi:cytidylate kinase